MQLSQTCPGACKQEDRWKKHPQDCGNMQGTEGDVRDTIADFMIDCLDAFLQASLHVVMDGNLGIMCVIACASCTQLQELARGVSSCLSHATVLCCHVFVHVLCTVQHHCMLRLQDVRSVESCKSRRREADATTPGAHAHMHRGNPGSCTTRRRCGCNGTACKVWRPLQS